VAWRRGRLGAWLAGVLAVAALVGAVGGPWLVAGDGAGDDAAAPIDDRATPDGRNTNGGGTGPRGTVPAARPQVSSSQGPGSAQAAAAWSAGEFDAERRGALRPNGDTGSNGPSVGTSVTTTARPKSGGSPNPSIPATTAPEPSVPTEGATTTTAGPDAPPPDNDTPAGDGGGLGGLLGGVLDVLGVG
jgi:hypothetical protein